MDWARILVYVTGTVDQELLARTEYLVAENRIMNAQLNGRLKLSDAEGAHWARAGLRTPQQPGVTRTSTQRPLDPSSFPSAIYIRNRQKIGDFTVSNQFRTTLHTPI